MWCWGMAHASMGCFQQLSCETVLKRVQFQQGRFNTVLLVLAGFQ